MKFLALLSLLTGTLVVSAEEKTCFEEADGGMCRASFPAWFYNAKTGACEKFIYGGCGGNGNRYGSEEECMEQCGNNWVWNSVNDMCGLPAVTGMCRARIWRFFYNSETGKCEQFIYGGCGGNKNNFRTEKECQRLCAEIPEAQAPGACELEKIVGPCKAAFRRFFYNKDAGKCEEFIYGGCGGNSNNFETIEDCEGVCAARAPSACEEEKVVGLCQAAFRRFFYNKETGKCEEFIFGGCGGNSNNFQSIEDCEEVCLA